MRLDEVATDLCRLLEGRKISIVGRNKKEHRTRKQVQLPETITYNKYEEVNDE